ncbi:MAG: hypothetical protein ACRECO_06065 [Xanthobacteraceae bacterium]
MLNIRTLAAGALALSFATVLGVSTPAIPAPNFDGLWSVVIVTEQGTCDRAYRYPIRISRGALLNEGSSPVTINGRVAGTGTVKVTVSHGSQSATGSGRLNGSSGAGTWRGGECAGTWQAERRGA